LGEEPIQTRPVPLVPSLPNGAKSDEDLSDHHTNNIHNPHGDIAGLSPGAGSIPVAPNLLRPVCRNPRLMRALAPSAAFIFLKNQEDSLTGKRHDIHGAIKRRY